MSKSTIKKRDWIYNTKTLDELKAKYDSWSIEYEKDLKAPYKQFCLDMAIHLTKFVPDSNSLILDIGCGTGMASVSSIS